MKVAILGFGTVGVGVYEMLEKCAGLEPGPVLVRPGKADKPFKVTSVETIVGDPSVGAVAEVMGGIEPANTYVAMALKAGKHVVTSNKALVAAHGMELCEIARNNGVSFLFSAACGGGVPFLHNLAIAAQSDKILSLGGILNGTTNFMLDAMQSEGKDYADVLKQAQALGYAEADPTADVSGLDALRKIMLACAVAYDKLPVDGFSREGIESITAYVEPVLLRDGAAECSVLENYNMARYQGRNSGPIVLMGQGAGRYPTASAVLRDLSGILRGERYMFRAGTERVAADNSKAVHVYYVRLPADQVKRLPAESAEFDGDVARVLTKAMSVAEMHAIAKELRAGGAKVFFAAVAQ